MSTKTVRKPCYLTRELITSRCRSCWCLFVHTAGFQAIEDSRLFIFFFFLTWCCPCQYCILHSKCCRDSLDPFLTLYNLTLKMSTQVLELGTNRLYIDRSIFWCQYNSVSTFKSTCLITWPCLMNFRICLDSIPWGTFIWDLEKAYLIYSGRHLTEE